MRLLLSVEHPAWAHQFRYMIEELKRKGHEIKVVAIRKDVTCELLDAFNIPYKIISETSGKGIIEKGIIFLKTTYAIFHVSRQFKPDMYFGRSSPMMAINSFFFRKPHILFEDTEIASFSLLICKAFSDVIMTPSCFLKDLGDKQLRIEAYKELFYLHPHVFKPNLQTLHSIDIGEDEKLIIIRFVAWDAHHDIGHSGIKDKIGLVKTLEQYGRIIITSEGALPPELEEYRMRISQDKLHDLLYYASLYIGEGGTMASEAAVLGTPSIYISSLVGTMGNFIELEHTYELLYSFTDGNAALNKAIKILKDSASKKKWRGKQERLLEDKIDVTAFMVWFIENYPRSCIEMRENFKVQYSFSQVPGDAS